MSESSRFTPKAQVTCDPQGRIEFFRRGAETSREHFHIGIWIDGDPSDLNQVEKVEYLLHPSFRRMFRLSRNRESKFRVTIWTWGLFEIRIIIFMLDGSKLEINYFLDYELPPDDGSNYIQVKAPA